MLPMLMLPMLMLLMLPMLMLLPMLMIPMMIGIGSLLVPNHLLLHLKGSNLTQVRQ
jgi:hypothetical protein